MPVGLQQGPHGEALFSPCGRHRIYLRRWWGVASEPLDDPLLAFVMLNPSIAGAVTDDRTARRCEGFARREGFSRMVIVNLYTLIDSEPTNVLLNPLNIFPSLHCPIRGAALEVCALAEKGAKVVAAWGAHAPPDQRRPREALTILRHFGPVYCLGLTKAGAPRHPLYLPATTPLEIFAHQRDCWLP